MNERRVICTAILLNLLCSVLINCEIVNKCHFSDGYPSGCPKCEAPFVSFRTFFLLFNPLSNKELTSRVNNIQELIKHQASGKSASQFDYEHIQMIELPLNYLCCRSVDEIEEMGAILFNYQPDRPLSIEFNVTECVHYPDGSTTIQIRADQESESTLLQLAHKIEEGLGSIGVENMERRQAPFVTRVARVKPQTELDISAIVRRVNRRVTLAGKVWIDQFLFAEID